MVPAAERPPRIAVVIPARNEAESVAAVACKCREVLARYPQVRVVVADNASADGTAAAARGAGAEVVPAPTVGYGAACLAAVAAVEGWADLLVFLDADGSSAPEEIPALLAPLTEGRADLALGYRTNPRHMTLPQRWGTRLAVALVNRLWGTGYRDMGPFRALSAAAFRRLQMRDRTWGWTIEMQVRARQTGLRVVEVPVSWLPRSAGRSKISGTVSGVLRAGLRILWTIARLYFMEHRIFVRKQTDTTGSASP
ncbi:MAG: glycosyltransferase family 2 protein [Acidobacteriota bacterium]